MRNSVQELVEASEAIVEYIKTADQELFGRLTRLRDAIEDFKDENKPKPVLLHETEVESMLNLFKEEGKSPPVDLAHTALYYIKLTKNLLRDRDKE